MTGVMEGTSTEYFAGSQEALANNSYMKSDKCLLQVNDHKESSFLSSRLLDAGSLC
jgi:hypothetical protein